MTNKILKKFTLFILSSILLSNLASCSWFMPLFLPKKYMRQEACDKLYESFVRVKNRFQYQDFIYSAAEMCLSQQPRYSLFLYEDLYRANISENLLTPKQFEDLKKKIADISFQQLKTYNKAIKYYQEYLQNNISLKDRIVTEYKVAESFFFLKKYQQSLEVAEAALKKYSKKDQLQFVSLKARSLMAQKKFDEAVNLFQQLIKDQPDQSNSWREYLALIYEEQKKFQLAIQEMEKINPPSSFVIFKIKHLEQRLESQPGAQ